MIVFICRAVWAVANGDYVEARAAQAVVVQYPFSTLHSTALYLSSPIKNRSTLETIWCSIGHSELKCETGSTRCCVKIISMSDCFGDKFSSRIFFHVYYSSQWLPW